ncbi:MAG: hypothetical protein A2381_19900 [Bdellovibrionales bacterium RIFOXYB1_FULL_37_110]|nr:MAG: hypothetical protein A2181_03535 [Bdellovibrionales bacterium RIFOXYA1_FULL_38_20]OFZ51001.1 MAG: hypothetical protein A2417_19685 [Bdellovibrionales bacterium RIFOXYC1_FULL_37_79]OFZ60213.1 MAG: hypothetical protein A2381_19900 [Bdellovibrionales bacterium RIFOXYB1_FULL_37_110]OFZ61575.1 MAG: hypothetical protein A2577_10340 [Bdellovibrionales bacterium RIFOXYD1_FULL_36_51]
MRSIIGLLFLGMLLSLNAEAVYLRYCPNLGNTFSLGFGFCVNNNFSEVSRTLGQGIFLRSCHNTSSHGISMIYEHCINENFSKIANALDHQVFFRFCNNASNHEVSWFFVNCINENFDRLEREL